MVVSFSVLAIRVKVQRERFWQLVTDAVGRVPLSEAAKLEPYLIDMPIWIAPAPSYGIGKGASKSDFLAVVGWADGSWTRTSLNWLIYLVALVAVIRVAWIGFIVNGFAADRLQSSSAVMAGILAGTAFATAAIAWLYWPTCVRKVGEGVEFQKRRRRVFIVASVTLGLLLMLRSSGAMSYYSRRKATAEQKAKDMAWRYRGRTAVKRQADLSMAHLGVGFYQNRRSGRLYYVPKNGKVRGGRKLSASNIDRIEEPNRFVALKSLVYRRDRESVLGALSDGIEESALSEVIEGRPEKAVALLKDFIESRSRDRKLRLFLKQIDLAAGVAIRYNLTSELDGLVAFLREIESLASNVSDKELLRNRIVQWLGPEGETWRRNRWRSQPHPLRWNGRRYDA